MRLLCGALLAFLLPVTTWAAPRPAMQVIIDQSEGMAPAVSGKSLYRRAIDSALKIVTARTGTAKGDLSWRLVGGGKEGEDASCEATRVLVPAGVTAGSILQGSTKEVPRGPRPLVAALEASQADMPHDRQRATVLVTSGTDNCGRNVCLAASDLRKSDGLGLVRVILVGGDTQAEGRLACLGPVVRVTDLEKLPAKLAEAVEILDRPAEVTVTANEANREVSGRVEFYPHEDDRPLVTGRTGEPIQLLAGTYHVRVQQNSRNGDDPREGWRRNVEIVADAHLNVRVPMGQEQAEVTATVLFNGVPAPAGTRVAIFHVGDTEGAIAEGFPDETIHVPAGKYDVRALIPGGPLDAIQVWKPEVKVLPGQKANVSLSAIQRRGELRAEVYSGSQKVKDANLMLLPSGSREESEAMFPPSEVIPVPAGKYTVLARLPTPAGVMQSFKDGVVIAANQQTDLRMELGPLGHLRVEVTSRKPEDGLMITLQKEAEEVDLGIIEAFTEYDLPAGTYDLRVEDHSRGLQKTYWQKKVKVAPGEKSLVVIKPPA